MPRLTTTQRDYGAQHQAERRRWQHVIDTEGGALCHAVHCLEPSRVIRPGAAWDLGHTPDRTRRTGPEHPRCNRSEGGRRGNARPSTLRTSRPW